MLLLYSMVFHIGPHQLEQRVGPVRLRFSQIQNQVTIFEEPLPLDPPHP